MGQVFTIRLLVSIFIVYLNLFTSLFSLTNRKLRLLHNNVLVEQIWLYSYPFWDEPQYLASVANEGGKVQIMKGIKGAEVRR